MLAGVVQVGCTHCNVDFGRVRAAYELDPDGSLVRVVIGREDSLWILLLTRGHVGPVTGQLLRRVPGHAPS